MGYDVDVASSITWQSGDVTRYMRDKLNNYFVAWKKDKDLHEKLGITIKNTGRTYENAVKYCDTDSVFFSIEEIFMDSVGYKGEFIDFALDLYNMRLKDYISGKLNQYCKMYNAFDKKMDGQPSFKLTLDYISHSILWVMKKKYVKNLAWKKNIRYKSLEKIEITGLESNKAMVPKFVREELKKIIKEILTAYDKNGISQVEYIVNFEAKRVRQDFDQKNVDELCNAIRISDYSGAVTNDTTEITFTSKASPAIKGAALHNWYLTRQEEKIRNLYPRIQSGMKVYTYHTGASSNFATFSFPLGECPVFAPPMDADLQFEKVFLNPLNNIVKALIGGDGKPMKVKDPNQVIIPPMW